MDEHHGFGAVFLLDGVQLGFRNVVGLFPRDALPLVFAAILAGAFHGMGQAVLVVHDLGHVEAAHAQAALREGVFGVAFHLHQLAVRVGVQQHTASQVASRTRPGASARDREIALLIAPRFLVWDQDSL